MKTSSTPSRRPCAPLAAILIAPPAGAAAGGITGVLHGVVYLTALTLASDPALASTGNEVTLILSLLGSWVVGQASGALAGGLIAVGMAVVRPLGLGRAAFVSLVAIPPVAATVWCMAAWTTGDPEAVVLSLQCSLAIVGGVILLDVYADMRDARRPLGRNS
ncbi:hypothetical protein [Herbiconiux sp.]|uniref:hypothetical protein n=1 Tax=Herbiconiux sp. TaxID=1871186 RepID=UPI0025BDC118|nr:hypothetical protein [Herbiconiux sp.]